MWQAYPSIDDMNDVDRIRRHSVGAGDYVAVEKVDGSNFALEFNGEGVLYYSRNKQVSYDGYFVGKVKPWDAMHVYHEAVSQLFELCGARKSVVVYGEYFGGWHPAASDKGAGEGCAVQRHVAYSPVHRLYAFDVLVDGVWLSFDEAVALLSRAGFPLVAEPLHRGSFEECLRVEVNGLPTSIPARLGYPLHVGHSIVEGVVIRPVRRREPGEPKKWIKKKSWHFLEERPNELGRALLRNEDFEKLCLHFCVRPRFNNVLSHQPELRTACTTHLETARTLFWADVQVDFSRRVSSVGRCVPSGACERARVEADRMVAEWLREEWDAQATGASAAAAGVGILG